MRGFSSKKLFKVLVILAIFGLLVFLNPRGLFNPLASVFGKIAYPFKKFSYSVSYGTRDAGEFLFSIGQLKEENRRIIGENQRLLSENARLHDMERENAYLREQVGLLPREKFDLEAAFVVARDPQGLGNWLEIGKGSEHGIREGAAVIISDGIMIGRVQQTFSDRSMVMLLTNPKSAINIMVPKSGARGIANGEYGLDIIADSILQTDSVSVGDEIVTSGIGSDVPRGLFIGTVQEVRPSDDHLFQQAVVASPADVSDSEAVFVVKGMK
ncbi:MAG: Cell shape-determining protein MreC [Candidatus Moranbacteria bacterium GW2011_GWE1_49_15]|nr:MAG: Cell shape-determining protein MreC [Candidatus Moranbacteria bacterium GW2011_GWE2_47_10]KKW06387.1 MAG: Cell shape-determining protein MreC [Candidatus Moranbacteria bacterium GW2011_GWE1_49_15]HBP00622.1 rod shape-determining protein MreC [Candidatus Moranbacteria bacterium]